VPFFADLAADERYRSAILWLGESGYDPGYPGTSGPEFRPADELRLNDFCVLLARVLSIEVADEAQASAAFVEKGIVADADRDLNAGAPPSRAESLSRAQMVAVLVRALDYAHPGLLPPAPNGDWASAGFDDPKCGDYLTRAGWNYLLEGLAPRTESGWEWDYSAPATRAEAAQILWNAAGAYLEP
jgi:hypothetical protein